MAGEVTESVPPSLSLQWLRKAEAGTFTVVELVPYGGAGMFSVIVQLVHTGEMFAGAWTVMLTIAGGLVPPGPVAA